MLPSIGALNRAVNRTGNLVMQHMEDSASAMHKRWHSEKNFNSRLDQVRLLGFDERFIRKWNYYLSYAKVRL